MSKPEVSHSLKPIRQTQRFLHSLYVCLFFFFSSYGLGAILDTYLLFVCFFSSSSYHLPDNFDCYHGLCGYVTRVFL